MLADRHITALMHSAKLRGKAGNWLASLNIYRRIIDERPDFLPAYCELARLYLDRDDLEGARVLVKKVVKREPENTEAHFLLGVIEYIEGNFDAALKSYRVVEQNDGLDCNLAMNMALVCEALGLPEDAINHLEYAISHGEANSRVYEVLADLYKVVGDYEKAIRTLELALRKFPREASLHLSIGMLQERAGNQWEAEAALRTAARIAPEDPGPLDELARLYSKLKRPDDEIAALLELTKLDPANTENWLRLSRLYLNANEPDKSVQILEESQEILPENTSIIKELKLIRRIMAEDGAGRKAPGPKGETPRNGGPQDGSEK
jgi:tetratricopeptide (TPR) repeat protein